MKKVLIDTMILCLAIAPALQRTLVFNSLEINEVNRVSSVTLSAAGKALNSARALASLGAKCKVAGFNGGHNGLIVNGYLSEYGVSSAMTFISAETRICTTLLDLGSGTVTELVEEAPKPSEGEIRKFVDDNVKLIKNSAMLVICGTLPPYIEDDFYCHFTSAARDAGVPFVIDSHKKALLSVLPDRPLVAKLNLRELETTFNCSVDSDKQIEELLQRVVEMGARSVFMTCGKDDAWLVDNDGICKIAPPAIDKHLNPIGSGDCTTAGIAFKLSEGAALQDAAAFGLACGSANVETLLPAQFDVDRVGELLEKL